MKKVYYGKAVYDNKEISCLYLENTVSIMLRRIDKYIHTPGIYSPPREMEPYRRARRSAAFCERSQQPGVRRMAQRALFQVFELYPLGVRRTTKAV